jgi:type VI secretion system protein ImpH
LAVPARFSFDAAARLLLRQARERDLGKAARFVAPPNLAYPASEIYNVELRDGAPPRVVTPVIGMIGPAGVLPRGYTEAASAATRDRSPSLPGFFDLLANRFVAFLAMAGAKYRPHRAAETARLTGRPDPAGQVLLCLTGYGTGKLTDRFAPGESALQHYAGLFSAHPRSADRLAALASDWLGRPVEVVQFAGQWLFLPEAERSRLPAGRAEGSFTRLGIDAAAGLRAWDPQARVILRVGPLDRAAFEALLPGGSLLTKFVALIRGFLGLQTGFAVNLVLRRQAVPDLVLTDVARPLLGWNTWLGAPASSRLHDPADPTFDAETVESAGSA